MCIPNRLDLPLEISLKSLCTISKSPQLWSYWIGRFPDVDWRIKWVQYGSLTATWLLYDGCSSHQPINWRSDGSRSQSGTMVPSCPMGMASLIPSRSWDSYPKYQTLAVTSPPHCPLHFRCFILPDLLRIHFSPIWVTLAIAPTSSAVGTCWHRELLRPLLLRPRPQLQAPLAAERDPRERRCGDGR